MPLVIITGYPCSGKTHRAHQLATDFRDRVSRTDATNTTHNTSPRKQIICIPSHHSSQDPSQAQSSEYKPPEQALNLRDQVYNQSAAEKVARAEEFSAIKRALTKNDVVIADAPNYIKGFRYQLWCEAKAAGTRCVVVHAAAREDECKIWNAERLEAWGWDISTNEPSSHQDEQHLKVGGVKVRVGKNVMGELEPESHTAIYGDKVLYPTELGGGTRSRSSSMGAGVSDDDDDNNQNAEKSALEKHIRGLDSMTLKSLYISDDRPSLQAEDEEPTQLQSQLSVPEYQTTAPTTPPNPKSSLPYSTTTLKSLTMRYEPPSPFTRWDTPLFTVPSTDKHPPYDSIWQALFPSPKKPLSKKALSQLSTSFATEQQGKPDEVKRHAATVLPQATGSQALQILESGTADVVKILLQTAREQGIANGEGGNLSFGVQFSGPGSTHPGDYEIEVSVNLPPNTPLSQPMLQRLRRKYTQIQRGSIAHGQGYASGREEVVRGFTNFLTSEWSNVH